MDIKKYAGLLALLVSSFVFSSCAKEAPQDDAVHFLVFGDSGYHYDYIPWWYSDAVYETKEEFEASFQSYWESIKGPIADFQVPPAAFHEQLGGYVHATGMHAVADAMRDYCRNERCQFGVVVGDNIYPNGATGGEDGKPDGPRLESMLGEPYGNLSSHPDFKNYTVFGNHDWDTSYAGAEAQLNYLERHLAFYMDGYFYRARPPLPGNDVELFVVDTELLLANLEVPAVRVEPDGRIIEEGELIEASEWLQDVSRRWGDQVSWLERALIDSSAKWKIVVAHHPLWSSVGEKEAESAVLRRLLLPMLCAEADLYLAGHDHTLEVHEYSCDRDHSGVRREIVHVVSGAASRISTLNKAYMENLLRRQSNLRRAYARGSTWGFVAISLYDDSMSIRVVEVPTDGRDVDFESAFTLDKKAFH